MHDFIKLVLFWSASLWSGGGMHIYFVHVHVVHVPSTQRQYIHVYTTLIIIIHLCINLKKYILIQIYLCVNIFLILSVFSLQIKTTNNSLYTCICTCIPSLEINLIHRYLESWSVFTTVHFQLPFQLHFFLNVQEWICCWIINRSSISLLKHLNFIIVHYRWIHQCIDSTVLYFNKTDTF